MFRNRCLNRGSGSRCFDFGLCFVEVCMYQFAQCIERSLGIDSTGPQGHRLTLAQPKGEETRETGGITFSSVSLDTDVRLEARSGLDKQAGRAEMQPGGVGQRELRFECRALTWGESSSGYQALLGRAILLGQGFEHLQLFDLRRFFC